MEELGEDEDAVLEDQVADDLRDRLAPRRQEKEAGEHRASEAGTTSRSRCSGGEREVAREEDRQPRPDRAEEHGRDEPEVRLHFVPDVHVAHGPEEQRGNHDRLDDSRHDDEAEERQRTAPA